MRCHQSTHASRLTFIIRIPSRGVRPWTIVTKIITGEQTSQISIVKGPKEVLTCYGDAPRCPPTRILICGDQDAGQDKCAFNITSNRILTYLLAKTYGALIDKQQEMNLAYRGTYDTVRRTEP